MKEEKDMQVKEFFYMAFWCIILTLIAAFSTASLGGAIPYPDGAPFGSAYSPPFYIITPTGCDQTLYVVDPMVNGTGNFSNHNLGQWNLFIHFGACPTGGLPTTCDPVIGKTPYCGNFYAMCLSTYFNRGQETNVIPNSKTWAQTYANTPYTWQDLDRDNSDMGYKSSFQKGANILNATTNLAIAASTLMWIGLVLFFLGPFFKESPYIFRLTPLILFLLGFIFWIIILSLSAATSQADSAAWATSFFQTCDVTITEGPVYYYGVAVIAFSGAFIICEVLFLYFHGYYPEVFDDYEENKTAFSSSAGLLQRR